MEEETVVEDKTNIEWTAIRDECVSAGLLNESCDLVAAAYGVRDPRVVFKKLACGCILVPGDAEEVIL